MSKIGTEGNPLRVAIIGSGPSGFYAAQDLQKQKDLVVEIDMYERLPTPFGLVRGGVAPDHPKIKSVTKVYSRIAQHDSFRFFGNVEFGTDIKRADLQKYYHAVIYAVGSSSDKRLNILGEDLQGSYPATEFVGWYNAHPDYRDLQFDLDAEAIAVIGVGNVAMDVTRIMARSQAELDKTDIAHYAQAALRHSNIKRIYVLGRRGPAQAAFTNPEIKELGEMDEADIIVAPKEVDLDEHSKEYLTSDRVVSKDVKNVEILREYANRPPSGKPKQIIMRFLVSPVEIIGSDKVEAIKIVKNELFVNERGVIRPRATDEYETIPVQMVFRSVGYRGVPLPDVPFYDRWGTIPNNEGRVLTEHETGEQVVGDYVVGWIKRGPSGVIGTNKPDSVETVKRLLEDVETGKLWSPEAAQREAVENFLKAKNINAISFADWQIIDEMEVQLGAAEGRPRKKFTEVQAMLEALSEHKRSLIATD
ncbi:MAG: FAD-dependent oxidoreductase [Anaerolineae bacterium]|nr:FAD-dependent oxidoreductase [Anaerolineae bacterium]MDQ7036395.1 FAD-dependent oxidoreductase [Anaerolineae bacterium]